ncbi:MAG: hypothetical protein HY535_04515 [Chloroflexi bacterium]|nr:hypothetical protein [Chloroflexota bacterium]
MSSKGPRSYRLGLVLLVTAGIVATILLLPGVALGLQATLANGKTPAIYKVGEVVSFNASILFSGAQQEVANIQAVTLSVQGDTSTNPGPESFTVNLPVNPGSFDITGSLPQHMQDRDSTLEVDVTFVDVSATNGYGYGYGYGYQGANINARIDYVIRWLPPILRQFAPPTVPPLDNPLPLFPIPGAAAGGAAALNASFLYELPVVPGAAFGAEVLGLAYDRFNSTLLVLMDNPGGNDTLLTIEPFGGFVFNITDVGFGDVQDVAWLSKAGEDPKDPASAGDIWIVRGSGPGRELRNISAGTPTAFTFAGPDPMAGLGANPYASPQWLLPSSFQNNPTLGIGIPVVQTNGVKLFELSIPAGPTGGGYRDVVLNDVPSQPTMLGGFAGKLGQFDLGGAFLGVKDVANASVTPPAPLPNIVGLALSQSGDLFIADFSSQGKIYFVSLGALPPPGANFARAIANDPNGNIFLLLDKSPLDQIIQVNDQGQQQGNAVNGPSSNLESLAFLGGFLYTVDNNTFPPTLYKLNTAGAVQTGYPKLLPPFVSEIGGLTLSLDGTKLVAVGQFTDSLFTIDPATGAVVFSTAMTASGQAPQPFGLDAITRVTGCTGVPVCPFFLGAKFTGFFFINPANGNIFDFKPVQVAPPFGITGLTQRGNQILFTDDSQQVFRAGVPGAPPAENTSSGDYRATFDVVFNPTLSQSVVFTVQRVDLLDVKITTPKDGDAFTSTPITVAGTVNDPTVATVLLGIDLPSTILLGNAQKTGPHSGETADQRPPSANAFSTDGLWHYTNSFSDPGKPRAKGQYSLAYTRDLVNAPQNPGPLNTYETPGVPNSGSATSNPFTIGSSTVLSFFTWYQTEGGAQFDRKLIELVIPGPQPVSQTIAQIVDFPPIVNGVPQFNAPPGTVYQDPGIAPWKLVFIPNGIFDPNGFPQLAKVELPLTQSPAPTVALRFTFDTMDPVLNTFEGWFVDDIQVVGAGFKGVQLPVTNLQFSGPFELAEGSNTISVQATRNAYTPVLTDSDSIKVSLDATRPILTILFTEDVNANGVLDSGEDIDGNGQITTLPTITNNPVQKVFGTYIEATPDLLTVKVNGKLVLSQKSFDSAKPSFSTSINLTSGANTIEVNLLDKAGLEPDPNDSRNRLSVVVKLDQTAPTLTSLTTIYPLTAVSATAGDPVVYQVNATDAETGILKVVIQTSIAPPATTKEMFAAGEVPAVLRDQWGATGNYLFPTIVPRAARFDAPLTLAVTATDLAGNSTQKFVQAVVNTGMKGWNSCFQRGGNLFALPIQPSDPDGAGPLVKGDIATLLKQKVMNVDPTFKANLFPKGGDPFGDPSNERDADGDVTLANVITSIQYFTGGTAATGTFKVYTPNLATDTLLTMEEGKAYWAFMNFNAFKLADLLPGTTMPAGWSCINMTALGTFLQTGAVPPVFPVVAGWNMVGRHTEDDTTVDQFLAGVTFPTRVWTSLLAFKNAIDFDYENANNLAMADRVTLTLGSYESRFAVTEPVRRGEGFWLFLVQVLTGQAITP